MNGIYGTVRPSNIDINTDVEIFYFYRPTRNLESEDFSNFKPLSVSCLEAASAEDVGTLLGMYNLRLPVDKFNRKGFYTIYIRPKEYLVNIYDVSVLAAYPNVRGLVFDKSKLAGGAIDDLTGYRIEYFDGENSSNRSDMVRLITSCNKCAAAPQGTNNTVRYRLVDSADNYVFCTVTPSTSSSYNTNMLPYIGTTNERVVLVNTKFNPIMIEVEMVDHDADTISYMLEGDQVRDRDNAIITTYNDEKEIYHQANYYTIKDKLSNPLYDVKETRDNIDKSQTYDKVINGNA